MINSTYLVTSRGEKHTFRSLIIRKRIEGLPDWEGEVAYTKALHDDLINKSKVSVWSGSTKLFNGYALRTEVSYYADNLVLKISGQDELSELTSYPAIKNITTDDVSLVSLLWQLTRYSNVEFRDVSTLSDADTLVSISLGDGSTLYDQIKQVISKSNPQNTFRIYQKDDDTILIDIGDLTSQSTYLTFKSSKGDVVLNNVKATTDVSEQVLSVEITSDVVKYDNLDETLTLREYVYEDVNRRLGIDYPIVETDSYHRFVMYNGKYRTGGVVRSSSRGTSIDSSYFALGAVSIDTVPDPDTVVYRETAILFQPVAGLLKRVTLNVQSNTLSPTDSGMYVNATLREVQESDPSDPTLMPDIFAVRVPTPPASGWWTLDFTAQNAELEWGKRYWLILSTDETTTDVGTYPDLATDRLNLGVYLSTSPNPNEINVSSIRRDSNSNYISTTRVPIILIETRPIDTPIGKSVFKTESGIGKPPSEGAMTLDEILVASEYLASVAQRLIDSSSIATEYDIELVGATDEIEVGSRVHVKDTEFEVDLTLRVDEIERSYEGDVVKTEIKSSVDNEESLLGSLKPSLSTAIIEETESKLTPYTFYRFPETYESGSQSIYISNENPNTVLSDGVTPAYVASIPHSIPLGKSSLHYFGFAYPERHDDYINRYVQLGALQALSVGDGFTTKSTAIDYSPNSRNGAYNNITQRTRFGSQPAWVWDGTSSYVTTDSASLRSAIDPFLGAITLWAKVDNRLQWSNGDLQWLYGFRGNTGQQAYIAVDGSTGEIVFHYHGTELRYATKTTDWFHVGCVWDSNSNSLYLVVNGNLVVTETIPLISFGVLTSGYANIGSRLTSSNFFAGSIKHVTLHSSSVVPAKIISLYDDLQSIEGDYETVKRTLLMDTNPIGLWGLGDLMTSTLTDATTNTWNGSYVNVEDQYGVFEQDGSDAFRLNGASSYLNYYNAGLISAISGDNGTVCFWVKFDSDDGVSGSQKTLWSAQWSDSTNNGIVIEKGATTNQLDAHYTGLDLTTHTVSADITGLDDQWVFVCVTWDLTSRALSCYINGTIVDSVSLTDPLNNSIPIVSSFIAGNHAGSMKHIGVWATTLSDEAISTLYLLPDLDRPILNWSVERVQKGDGFSGVGPTYRIAPPLGWTYNTIIKLTQKVVGIS